MILVLENVQTLRKNGEIPELVASSENTSQDIICIQEHRFIHDDSPTKEHNIRSWRLITCSAWKNSANAGVGGIRILLNTKAYKALVDVEMEILKELYAVIIQQTNDFYEVLESLTRKIPKHNMLIVGEISTPISANRMASKTRTTNRQTEMA